MTQVRDPGPEARALLSEVAALRARVAQGAEARMARWRPWLQRGDFTPSAANLASYLALRGADLRGIQQPLSTLGLSSLGRAEAHVRASLDALLAALGRIAGEDAPPPYPLAEAFHAPDALLAQRRDALFGPGASALGTRVMVTLPTEAAADAALLERLIAAGADCVRVNCAHDGPDAWRAMVTNARAAAAAAGRRVTVEMDLGGPKLRVEEVRAAGRLHAGDRLVLASAMAGTERLPQATLSDPELLAAMREGGEVWLDDGKLRGRVVEAGAGRAVLEVLSTPAKGYKLKPRKGVNLPGADLLLPALTADDLAALEAAVELADMVAFSFVQTVSDVEALVAALEARRGARPLPAIVLKIETQAALRNLPDLIVAAGGRLPVAVMIARGDLAAEVGFQRMSEVQEEILWICEAAQVPVIWATQVLEGLVKEGQASRAETTDAAMGHRAECIMLNKGPYLAEGVAFLRDVGARMARHAAKKNEPMGPLSLWREIGDGTAAQ